MKLLTIIIPVYNASATLQRLFDSLAPYLSAEWTEVIVIDDGSTDGSLIQLEKRSDREHFLLVSQPNQGVSAARNRGLQLSTGKYIWFVDSDDWVNRDSVECIRQYVSGEYEWICLRSRSVKDDGSIEEEHELFASGEMPKEEWQRHYDGNSGMLWQYILRRDIIMKYGIQFVEWAKWFEDADFILNYSLHCSKMLLANDQWYYSYRINPVGAMSSSNYEDRLLTSIRLSAYSLNRSRNMVDVDTRFVCARMSISIAWCLRELKSPKAQEMYDYCKNLQILPLPLAGTIKQKIQIALLNFSLKLYKLLFT